MTLPDRYTRTAIMLHWVIAVLIAANVFFILTADKFGDENIRFMYDTHKSIGLTVLGLVIIRLLWRVTHRPPELPADYKSWERSASKAAHLTLYFIMFFLPISGWLHDSAWEAAAEIKLNYFGLFELPRLGMIMEMEPIAKKALHGVLGEAHEIAGYALYALVFLHIGGALKHQFVDKHRELQRML
jgi:cytochrome b561